LVKDTLGVALGDLRPTQITVGYHEVGTKRQEWRSADKDGRVSLLRSHVIPAVLGPKKRIYIVDHHHFARALLEEGAPYAGVYIIEDLSHLEKDEFWIFLDNSDWCHAYDEKGQRRRLSDIPKRLVDLKDDPFRSLVGQLIQIGACAKSEKPFAEFIWADFLRRRIDPALVKEDFSAALLKAIELAGSSQAKSLPGWCARPS